MKKTRKISSVLLTALPLGDDGVALKSCGIGGGEFGEDSNRELEYKLLDNDTYEVIGIGWLSDADIVIIPSTNKGKAVTSIGNGAFSYCESLTNVVIPTGVTSIGNSAFSWCESLTSVEIPDSVTNIGEEAFFGCYRLTRVYYMGDVESWCKISGLECLMVASNIKLYLKNELVTDLVIPARVIYIGESAFEGCTDLMNVKIGDNVTSIGKSAFYGCTGLTNVKIGDNVTSIGESAFYGCAGLTNVKIGDNVTSIGESTFYGCTGLTNVKIGDNVTNIGESAFYGCTGLTNVKIGDSVTNIGEGAFEDCENLTNVVLPVSVTSIGGYVFNGSRLTDVYYKGTEEEWKKISIDPNNSYLTDAKRYYYSETKPTVDGNWWHYVDGVVTVW